MQEFIGRLVPSNVNIRLNLTQKQRSNQKDRILNIGNIEPIESMMLNIKGKRWFQGM
jgi:hypothetical protein